MATRFVELDELFDDALELPVLGRDGTKRIYRIPSPSAEDGLRIQKITAVAVRLVGGGEAPDQDFLDDAEERDLIADALGSAYAEMQADGVDWSWLRHAGLTAVIWISQGQDPALTYWKAAGDPSRLSAPNRQARREAAKSNGSAPASTTRKRASGSSTTAPRAGKTARKASRA